MKFRAIRRLYAPPSAIEMAHVQLAEFKRQELRYAAMLDEVQAALNATQNSIARLQNYVTQESQ